MRLPNQLNQQELDDIYYFIDSHITTTQKFCSTVEISKRMKIPYSRVESAVNTLIAGGRLRVVFEVPRKVKLFAPEHIARGLSLVKPVVPWMDEIALPEKQALLEEFNGVRSKLEDFEQFEKLLTTTGPELVQAVGHTLKWLGFEVNLKEDEGHEDIEFNEGVKHGIIEVKGLEKHAKIDELRQAVDYHLRKISDMGPREITTILLVNHYRTKEPDKRPEPFSVEVIRTVARNYQFIYLISTTDLYREIGRCVSGALSKPELRKRILSGALNYKSKGP